MNGKIASNWRPGNWKLRNEKVIWNDLTREKRKREYWRHGLQIKEKSQCGKNDKQMENITKRIKIVKTKRERKI